MFFMAKLSEAFLPVGLHKACAENNCAIEKTSELRSQSRANFQSIVATDLAFPEDKALPAKRHNALALASVSWKPLETRQPLKCSAQRQPKSTL